MNIVWRRAAEGDRGGQDPHGAGQADSGAQARGAKHGLQDGGSLPHQEALQRLLQQEHRLTIIQPKPAPVKEAGFDLRCTGSPRLPLS